MTRVKRGSIARKKRSRVLESVTGFRGSNRRLFRVANQRKIRALVYNYIDRRNRKRVFRRLWTKRINAAARSYDLNYSQFRHRLNHLEILVNRKVLAQMSVFDKTSLKALAKIARHS